MNAQLAASVLAALPQTQCTRCGYADCAAYADAVAHHGAPINRCPPGGMEGVSRLAALTGVAYQPLDPICGPEGPRRLAVIDEDWCIGCTLCIEACPVDSIIGSSRSMHTVIEAECTGCELCLPVCPVDCIAMVDSDAGAATGWQAWSSDRAERARERYAHHAARLSRDASRRHARHAAELEDKLEDLAAASTITDANVLDRKRELAQAALARARARRRDATST